MFFKHQIKFIFLFIFVFNATIFSVGFKSGTLIKTKENYVPINLLKPNDLVLSYNFKTRNIEESKIKAIKIIHSSNCISLLINNETIQVSPNHKFYCPMNKNRWTLAKDIKAGDYILKNVKELIKVEDVNEVEEQCDFYCLSIEKNHNYFVSNKDIFVHNFTVAIPIFTYVIGQGFAWAGVGKWLAAAGAILFGYICKINDIEVSGLNEIGGIKVSYGHKMDDNKINHIINKPDHGFLDSCNAGGPDEDPDKWIRRIKKVVSDANISPEKFSNTKPTDIPTHWKSSDPKYGELIVRVFKVRGMMQLGTAFLKDLRLK